MIFVHLSLALNSVNSPKMESCHFTPVIPTRQKNGEFLPLYPSQLAKKWRVPPKWRVPKNPLQSFPVKRKNLKKNL